MTFLTSHVITRFKNIAFVPVYFSGTYKILIFKILIVHFFYKQPVYKQLVLGWEIAQELSGLNLLLLSNNKNYRLKKSGVFLS